MTSAVNVRGVPIGWRERSWIAIGAYALATGPQTETAQLGDRTNRNAHD
jgi:hypothetical protein